MKLLAKSGTKEVYLTKENQVKKVFDHAIAKQDILQEALNTARVEENTDLHIAKVLGVDVTDEKWGITYAYIEGKTLAQLMEEEPEHKMDYLEKMVDLQMEMQSKSCPLLNRMKEKLTRQIQSVEEIDDVVRYDLLTRLDGMPKHNKLCHGDFEPGNIIVQNGVYYILDWTHATQGNASGDIARTYLLLCLKDKVLADTYLDLFCKKSHTDKTYVYKWLPIVAAAQLTKQKPEEKALLLSWTEVVDYE